MKIFWMLERISEFAGFVLLFISLHLIVKGYAFCPGVASKLMSTITIENTRRYTLRNKRSYISIIVILSDPRIRVMGFSCEVVRKLVLTCDRPHEISSSPLHNPLIQARRLTIFVLRRFLRREWRKILVGNTSLLHVLPQFVVSA